MTDKNVKKLKIKEDNLTLNSESLIIHDLEILNQDLVNYLLESENKVETLEHILDIGVKTLNSLKNSIERDFTEKTFEKISKEMKLNLDNSMDDLGNEFEKYFNEDGEFVKEINENKKNLINEINTELEKFIDPNNRDSAISKLTEILETEEGKVLNAFEKALNPENTESQIFLLKEKLEKKFSEEVKSISDDLEKILQQLKIDSATNELKEKSTGKGATHEDFVQQVLSEVAVGDFVERTGEIVGLIPKSKVGDHVVTLNTNTKTKDLKIVFESKSANTYNSTNAIVKELEVAIKNRGADYGVFVFDNFERFNKVSSQPFHIISENMALTVLNEDVGKLPLKIAYIWAKNQLMNLDEVSSKEIKISYDEILKGLNEALKEAKRLITAKSNNKKAFDALEANEELIPEIRKNIDEKLKDLVELLDYREE
jgi:hypothetical protein